MPVVVYNRKEEDHSASPNNYPIFRGGSVLGNPLTHKKLSKTLAIFQVKSREEAIERYSEYFDAQYGHNKEFTELIDEIYAKYKRRETIYLECYCKPLSCHGDVIVEKLKQRLLREKIKEIKLNKDARQGKVEKIL